MTGVRSLRAKSRACVGGSAFFAKLRTLRERPILLTTTPSMFPLSTNSRHSTSRASAISAGVLPFGAQTITTSASSACTSIEFSCLE